MIDNIPPLIRRPDDEPGDPVRRYIAEQQRRRRVLFLIQLGQVVFLFVVLAWVKCR